MKTTVKLDSNKSVVIRPAQPGLVPVDLCTFGIAAFSVNLSPDQAAILGQALCEQAAAADIQQTVVNG